MINNGNCEQKWKLYKGWGGGDRAGVVLKSTHFVDAIDAVVVLILYFAHWSPLSSLRPVLLS